MLDKEELTKQVNNFFDGSYTVTSGTVIPDVGDIPLGKVGRELDLAMLFIDIRESTKIVDGFRRVTAAKMYKSFLWGVAKIAKDNGGELRSFNGDGVLMAFIGESKRNNAVKAAMQMKWFCNIILKPRIESYFAANSQLANMEFNFGIGIDSGKVLVVRGGIRGENNNDLVWAGNATNYAVKLSSRSVDGYHIYISEETYSVLDDEHKFGGDPKRNMWEARSWDGMTIYRTNWYWNIN
jgi:class 3 adenylate cyclase